MKKYLFFMMSMLIGSMIAHRSYGMEPEQVSIKPVMSQQQLLVQKDELQALVKNIWEECLQSLEVKFPGFIEKDQFDNGFFNSNWQFERQPSTDENILFIKQTVENVITKTAMPFMRFDKKTKAEQEQALKWMLERMMSTALVELLLKDVSESLDWCTCTAEYKRITFALLVVNEAREKYPNKNKRIVYTSFASGGLLQDYLILSELLVSHTNVLVNLIDLNYPDIPTLAKNNLNMESPRDLHMLEMKNKQEYADIIDSFKIKMAQIISTRQVIGADYNFEVNIYQNAYEYIARAQTNPNEKSNILILVDPAVGSYGMADFPSLANVINIWVDEEQNPVFTVYLPRHHGVQVYELIPLDENEPLTVDPKIAQYLRKQLIPLIVHTKANKRYTPRFVKALLDRAIFSGQVTDEAMAQIGFPELMQKRVNLRKQALKDGDAVSDIIQPLTPIKLGTIPVLLSWGTDAHISFQDLVWDALAPNAIVYQLYATDPAKPRNENDKIIKVDLKTYKQSDVITPNAGRYSSVKSWDFPEEQQPEGLTEEEPSQFSESEEEPSQFSESEEESEEHYFEPAGRYKRIL